jgi:D-glycero-beta-D-manno-heptose-7-phosphate kinase
MKREIAKIVQDASVLIVGDSMLDQYWFGDVDRISPEAPVPIVRVTHEEFRPGGAANVALNVRAIGAKALLLSVVGMDAAADTLRGLLEDEGVEARFRPDETLKTTVKLRINGRSQQLLRVDFENKPGQQVLVNLEADFDSVLDDQNAVLFSDYGKGGLSLIEGMIAKARKKGKAVLVDPKGSDYSAYRGASLITPNRGELAQVVGSWSDESSLIEKAQALRTSLDLGALLLTRSEEGMTLFDDQGHLHIAADAREVFDVTGAGDTVIGVMASLIAAGISPRQAMPIANKAGGIVVGKFGTATITAEELF